MAPKDIQTCVIFRSTRFATNWPDQAAGVATMNELGMDCAQFIASHLRGHDSIDDVGDIEPDDWGWIVDLTIHGEAYELRVLGAMGPQPIYWWTVQLIPLGFLSQLFSRNRKHCNELVQILNLLLTQTDGITDVTWMTTKEYMSLPDLRTLESRRNS